METAKTIWTEEDVFALSSRSAKRAIWNKEHTSDMAALLAFIEKAQESVQHYYEIPAAREQFDYQLSQFVRRYVAKNNQKGTK